MTAYEKKESSATNNRMDTADTSKGKRNDTATPQDTASADKVTESSEEWQEQEEKFSPTPSGNTGSEEDEHEQFALTRRDEAVSLVNKMEDDAEIAPEIELTISNWDTLFGEEGIVKTPLGEVKMGENQFAKLMRQGRESKLGMIKPTLENPDVIIEASSEAKEGSITKRGSSYIFVKAFRKSDGLRYYYFTSVTVSKEGKEVVVSSQEKSRNRLLRLLTDEEIIWRTPKDATTSSAEGQGLDYVQSLDAETATKGSGLTPQRISSADKVTESSEEWQEQEEKFSPTPSGNTGSEEGTYTLSSKTSENGESFYQNNDGNIDLADIPDEVFDKIGKPKAPFRLTPSMLKHVFDRHGKEMGLHHADDAIDFVLDVMNNFDHVRQGDKGAIIFSIENGRSRTGRRAVTILLDSQRGEYYGIKTSGYERIEGLHKRPLLWEKGAKETSATGVAPANVTTNKALQGNEPTGSASNHGNDPMGKVTESEEELQEKEDKFTPAPIEDGEDYVDYAARVAAVKAQHDAIKAAENATDTNPTDGQKKAGNYKKGHVQIGAFDISVEQPKGSVRRGKDADGKEWESKMNNTYGYFRGTEGVDGDHIDVFLSNDIDGWNGRKVFVVDQYNPDGTFDEHKVMLGFNDADDAKSNYLANYEKGWENGRRIDVSTTNLEDFEKWISSSHRKTKPFAEYKNVRIDNVQSPSEKYQPIIRATFNKVKREQGIIEPIAEKKRKPFTVFDVTVKEPRRPMFGGVYHDGGMAVATNGVVMFAHKEAYDEAKEGKIITSKGDVIEGKFPDWRGAIPKETIPTGLQTEPLLEFVNGALARMKAEKAKKYEVDGALAYIKFQDGNVVCCQLADLQKMLRAAKSIGADDLRLGTDKEFLVAESPAGKAIVIIQGEEKARYNAGYNNFAYEAPMMKGEEEVSDGALDNPYPSEQEVEQEANEVTEKLKEERNEERVTRTQKKRGRPTKGQQEYRKRKEREARKKEAKELSEEYKRLSEETDELWNILEENKDAPEELVIEGFHSEASWVRATAAEHKNLPPSLLEEAIADPSLRKYAIKNKNITDSQFHHAVKLSLKDGNTEFLRSLNSDDRLTEEESLSIMEFMWEAHSKRYGTIYFSSKYPSVLRRFYENHGTQLLAQKVLARDKNTPQDILEKLYESGNEEVRLEIAGNDSVPIPVVLKMLDLPNNLAFREKLAYRRNLPQDIISRLFHDNSKSVRQTIIQLQPLDLDLMNKILKKKNITELGLLAENRNTPIFIQDSILAISAPPKSWGVNGDYYLEEIQKKARLGIAQNKRASAGLLEDLYNEISSGRLLSDSDLGEAIAEHPNTSKSVLADIYSRFGEKYPRIKDVIEKRSDFTAKEVEQESKDDNTGNVVLKQFSNVLLSADTESQRLATDAALEGLKRAGVPIEVVSDEQAAAMLGEQKGVELSAKQKRALETASPAMQDHSTVVSSADGTKVLKDLDNTIEEDLKITDHVQFMKTPSGTLYGWTVGGKIYLTKDGLNPNTPIHEYTHLWARAMKERNKEGWQSVKELLRDTPVWDEVLKDKNYQDILDDEDAIASEALSRISGQKNAEKMEAEARKMIDEAKDYVDKAKAISLLERMKSALKKFWNWVGKDLFGIKKFSSVDEITDRVLYDLVNKTKLTEEDKEEIAKRDKLYLEAVERGDMETAQRMVNEAAAQNGYFPNSEYQGTSAYNGKAPYGNGYFLTKEERKEAYENDEFDDDTSLDDYVNSGIDPKNLGDLTNDSSYRHADDARKEAIENLRDVFQNKRQTITMYRSVPSSVKEGSFRNGDWVTPSYAYAVENARIHGWGNKFRVIKQDVPISEVWFDGNDIAEFGYGNEDDFINDKDYLYNNTKNNRKLPDAVTYDDKGKVIPLSKRFNKRKGDPRFQIVDNSQTEEERQIIETAKESGTYMKAPNGKPTRLTEKQWAQVRTKAFKSWFGDWEKAARIEKLRKSEPVEITGEEIAPSDELKQYKRNALEYGKTLRGEYTNEDTKETIALTGGNSRGGIREILQHDYKDIEHLQSIAAIPQIIEKSTYIDEAPNEDVEKYPGIKSFRYYVCGLKIGNNDYTVKAVIAVQNNGDRYYDHKLSSIEKGKLLSIIPTIQEAGIEDNLPLSIGKDRRLLSILQTNSSKVVDENGEPLVVHHSTDNEFDTFSKEKLGENTDQNASDDSVAATAHIGFWFNTNDLTGTLFQERDVAGYLDVKEPYEFNSLESLVEDMSYYSSAEEFVDRLKEDGYDGIVVRKDEEMGGTSYVAFEPNQIKSATDNNGEFSQESDDIRYRESKGSSERTLVGIHNISADKLSKAIKQGGLANPSVAVIDISKQQHTGYGEISLIMPSDKINKRTGKNAGTFEGDAWTPMYPSVERQMSREGSLVMEHDIKALPNEMQLGVRNALRNWLDSRVDTKLSYLYLFQQGKAPDFETIKPKYNKEVHRAFGDIMHEVTNVYDLSKNDIEKLVDLYVKTELNGDINEFNQSYERNIAKHKEFLSNKKPGSLRYEKANRLI